MRIRCVWEHNGNDSILYAANCIGAFTRSRIRIKAVCLLEKLFQPDLKKIKSISEATMKSGH